MAPTGFKRSRALWDNARATGSAGHSRKEHWMAVSQAVLYELQPIRFSQLDFAYYRASVRRVLSGTTAFVTTTLPSWLRRLWLWLKERTVKQWLVAAGVLCYYGFVRYVHYLLEAGPMVIIITALVAIFTVGLGEDEEGAISAYSVFNRGFQKLLGSLDADALLQQHVGGGMGGLMMMGGAERGGDGMQENGRGMAVNDDDDDNHGNNDIGIRRQRRQQQRQLEEREGVAAVVDHNNDNDGAAPAAAAAAAAAEEPDNNNSNRNRSRKSGKKARRGNNVEQRRERGREMQRQRDAAAAMGFHGDGGEQELIAMQRLIEDQVADQQHQ